MVEFAGPFGVEPEQGRHGEAGMTVRPADRVRALPGAQAYSRWLLAAVAMIFALVARRWLFLTNGGLAMFVGLPLAAPVLLAAGLAMPAAAIYATYRAFCHQLPYRSFFLFGPETVYSRGQLEAMPGVGAAAFEPGNSFFGNAEIGYKMAFCERDLALYGAILVAGLAYGLIRQARRGRASGLPLRPLDWRLYLVSAIPIALDGFTQLFGWRESTWELRLLTGGVFGAASVWFAYPYFEVAMRDLAKALDLPVNRST